jgi:hypothetical protein
MVLFWRIRYLDTRDRQFKDRDLFLDTGDLDPATRAAVEASNELREHRGGAEMMRYRHLFSPMSSAAELQARVDQAGSFAAFCVPEYSEDENSKPLSSKEVAVALIGSEDAVMVPSGFRQKHDLEYFLAEKKPIDIAAVHLAPEQAEVLSYFARDIGELAASALFSEGPGTLSGLAVSPRLPMTIETAVTDEEIRSFVTIFRRLYMTNERANLQGAAAALAAAIGDHPLGKWISASAADIAAKLDRPPEFVPFVGSRALSFSLKLLIDVFLYTQYAHQPDERRLRQFHECLQDVGGDRAVLTYLFLTEVWSLGVQMRNVGVQIVHFFDVYRRHHGLSLDIVTSAGAAHPGVGTLEKKHEREDRVVREKAEELARAMWREQGQPAGGYQFVEPALAHLRAAMSEATGGGSNARPHRS